MSDVTDLLDQLVDGQTDLDTLAEDFRTRAWPRRTRTQTSDANDMLTLDSQDPEVEPDGSFSEVAGYYSMGRIDDQQYSALATAAAEAMKSAPTPGTPAAGVNQGTEPTP